MLCQLNRYEVQKAPKFISQQTFKIILYSQALYTALHRLKEVLVITDDVLRIQYANKSAERLLNMRLVSCFLLFFNCFFIKYIYYLEQDEIISKPLADIFMSDVSSISSHGKNIREFDGILTVRRKSQEGIPMHVRVVPVACIGRYACRYLMAQTQ